MTRRLILLLSMIALMMPQMMKAQKAGNNGDIFWYFHDKDTNPYITLDTRAEDIIGYILLGPGGENYMLKNGTWLEQQRKETDSFGNVHVTYNQKTDPRQSSYYQLVLHFHPDGSLYYKNGAILLEAKNVQNAKALNSVEKISAERASIIATGSPLNETVWTFANYKDTPREAYQVKDMKRMQYVYVDAYSGEVLYTIPLIHSYAPWSQLQGNAVTLSANTTYNGLQELTMLQTDKGYILRDPQRNIITIDATDVNGGKEVPSFTKACNDVLFTNEKALLNQKYSTKLRGFTVWLDPLKPEVPKSLSLRIYYVDNNNDYVSDIINTPINGAVWTDDNGLLKSSFTFTSLPDIDLINYHHFVELTIDGRNYYQKDIILPGNKESEFMFLDEKSSYLQCLFDVATDALQPSIDVHWAIQKVYDMYDQYYGIKGCDGKGSQILNIVNPNNNVLSLGHEDFPNNACAFGYEEKDCHEDASYVMVYGMGHVGKNRPMTPYDITAHEFTHNITAGCCNDLLYMNESGSLNEALADCMAMVAEDYLLGTPTWTVGENVTLYSDYMRSFSDPWYSGSLNGNLVEAFAQPKYYGGRFWIDYTTAAPSLDNDYGGAHINAGVFCYLFYLLCEGGEGLTNEVGETTDILPVGMDRMKDIIFHTMRYYDSSLCNYNEIADNLLMAIADIYGTGSETINDLQKKLLHAYEFVGMKSGMYPTGITHHQKNTQATNPRTYNLYGIPIGDSYKGIVIKDGKKVVLN